MEIKAQNLRLRPSSADRWVKCNASVFMEAHYPDDDESEAAREGTAAHWVASEVLTQWTRIGEDVPVMSAYLNKPAENGVIITQDMLDAVEVYVSDVLKTANDTGGLRSLYVEYPVKIESVHANNEGTLDGGANILSHGNSTLYVWDFKYGWGIVNVFSNWQLIDYALGIIWGIQKGAIRGPVPDFVEFRIVQPRPYHRDGSVRSWRVSVAELYEDYLPTLMGAAALATSGLATAQAGPHCSYCKARHACPALQSELYRLRDMVAQPLPDDISGGALGNEVEFLRGLESLLKARKSGVEAQALAEIKSGRDVPGWGAEPGKTHRKWKGTDDDVLSLGMMLGVDMAVKGVISPAQAEKLGADKELVKSFTESPPGALKLVKRDKNEAEKVFKK